MVNLTVSDGQIRVAINSEDNKTLYQEIGNSISELLVEYQIELLRKGMSRDTVNSIFQEMLGSILAHNASKLNTKIRLLTEEVTITS